MTAHRLPLLLLTLCLGVAAPVWAENADRKKPMNIDAQRLEVQGQLRVFSGGITVTQGSLTIRGERMEVRDDATGNPSGLITGSTSQPAFFRQKREGVEEYIEGQADSIQYNSKADTLTLSQNARLRRYRGTALADEISGSQIVYDNLNQKFSANGNTSTTTNGAGSERVRATITPKPEGESK